MKSLLFTFQVSSSGIKVKVENVLLHYFSLVDLYSFILVRSTYQFVWARLYGFFPFAPSWNWTKGIKLKEWHNVVFNSLLFSPSSYCLSEPGNLGFPVIHSMSWQRVWIFWCFSVKWLSLKSYFCLKGCMSEMCCAWDWCSWRKCQNPIKLCRNRTTLNTGCHLKLIVSLWTNTFEKRGKIL